MSWVWSWQHARGSSDQDARIHTASPTLGWQTESPSDALDGQGQRRSSFARLAPGNIVYIDDYDDVRFCAWSNKDA